MLKEGMQSKGPRVNMRNNKFMIAAHGVGLLFDLGACNVQYDELVSGLIPYSASNVGSGYTRNAVVSKANSLPIQTMCSLDTVT